MVQSYRKEIDGLRAIAVIPVVLFHAGIPGFEGGYVGVDVFFVISGYLITQIVAAEVDANAFSLLGFYERRIRRIFPALFVMLAATTVVGYILFLPDDYAAYSKTALSALVSISNYRFYEQAGYFDEAAIVKPILHTWSLAVEEQFYIFLPLLLVLTHRWRRHRKIVFVTIALVSLALALQKTPRNPDFAFYLLPARAWELLAGSLLALKVLPTIRSRPASELMAALGVVLVAVAVFLFDADTPFPGPWAAVPVVGAMLVIHCASGARTGELLGANLPRGIGLVSYSLYLWHWPVIVFIAYYTQGPLTSPQAIAAIVVSLAIAIVSWRLVEQPFRGDKGPRGPRLWNTAIGASAWLAIALAGFVVSHGARWRMPDGIEVFAKANNKSDFNALCELLDTAARKSSDLRCLLGPRDVKPHVAIWADSHGQELSIALEKERPTNRSLLAMVQGGCPPSLDPVVYKKPTCAPHNRAVLTYLKANPSIDTVIVAAYFLSPRYQLDEGFGQGVLDAVYALRAAGKRVIVVGPVPKPPFDVSRKLQLAQAFGLREPPGINADGFLRSAAPTFALLKKAESAGAEIVYPNNVLCDDKTCRIVADGKPLYIDDNHLSIAGAALVAPLIQDLLRDKVGSPSS